ncbi:AsmA family protein [Candidatus Pelagibacter sp.]|nr:AsmA family protein [Candidatus Pelagibacter sp.]
MSKHNYFVIFLKKINLSINSLLEKYLNKLNFNNLSNIARSNKVFLTFVTIAILFLSYLSIPHVYNNTEIEKELKNQLLDKFSLNFNFPKNFSYKFFPRPHFIVEDSFVLENQIKISNIKKLRIYVSLDNLFSLKKINIKNVILENTNFNFNMQNSNFFIKLLDNNFLESSFTIKDSNIFFRNAEQEVLFINKIIDMKYYYEPKELRNIFISKNKIFNMQYFIETHKDEIKNKIFSKINFNSLKLQIKNEFDYSNYPKKGLTNFIYKKNKSQGTYELNKNSFSFIYLDKPTEPNFFYQGDINFKPFYSIFSGNNMSLKMSNFFNSNSLFFQLAKTEVLNNNNLNINFKINAKKIFQFQNIIDIILNLRIKEGLIDIDNTSFSWSKFIDFKISNSLLYVNENQLILDAKLTLDIKNYSEIYKFLQTSKNLRPELKKIEFDFKYNFDQQIIEFNSIKIDNIINKEVGNILKKMILKTNKIQNKIYFKNVMKEALTAYAG